MTRGSPPRVRGIHGDTTFADGELAVHPRVYGEYASRDFMALMLARFTPACTGNTSFCVFLCLFVSVHPRVYGEYVVRFIGGAINATVHPRVYGEYGNVRQPRTYLGAVHPRVYGEYEALEKRYTPAGGSPPRVRGIRAKRHDSCCTSTVHPRVYGEYYCWQHWLSRQPRFTPACTGNTKN